MTVNYVVPNGYIALTLSIVTDLEVCEARSVHIIVSEGLDREDEQPRFLRVCMHGIKSKRHLFNELFRPIRVIVAPDPIVLAAVFRIAHQKASVRISFFIIHRKRA